MQEQGLPVTFLWYSFPQYQQVEGDLTVVLKAEGMQRAMLLRNKISERYPPGILFSNISLWGWTSM